MWPSCASSSRRVHPERSEGRAFVERARRRDSAKRRPASRSLLSLPQRPRPGTPRSPEAQILEDIAAEGPANAGADPRLPCRRLPFRRSSPPPRSAGPSERRQGGPYPEAATGESLRATKLPAARPDQRRQGPTTTPDRKEAGLSWRGLFVAVGGEALMLGPELL